MATNILTGTLSAVRTEHATGNSHVQILRYELLIGPEHVVVRLLGGPTGHESCYLNASSRRWIAQFGWLACSGDHVRWDRLYVPADAMARIFERLSGAPTLKAARS